MQHFGTSSLIYWIKKTEEYRNAVIGIHLFKHYCNWVRINMLTTLFPLATIDQFAATLWLKLMAKL